MKEAKKIYYNDEDARQEWMKLLKKLSQPQGFQDKTTQEIC